MPSFSAKPRQMDVAPVGPDVLEERDEDDVAQEGGAALERSDAKTSPPPYAGTGSQRGGLRRMERTITVIMIVLMLLIPAAIIITENRNHKNSGKRSDHNDQENGDHWPIYMAVSGKKTLSGLTLDIRGGIIVNRGAELNIVDCDINMNGTFIVYGKLNICNTRLQDFLPARGLAYNGRDASNLSLPVDLRGYNSAALNIRGMSGFPSLARVQVYFVDDGVRTAGPRLELDPAESFQNGSIDLTAYCGNDITVMMTPLRDLYTSFSFQGLELSTDTGTEPYDIANALLGEDWSFYDFRFPFNIIVDRGNLVLDQSRLIQFDDDKELVFSSEARIRIRGSTLELDPRTDIQGYGGRRMINGYNTSLDISGSSLLNNFGVHLSNSVMSINDSLFFNVSQAIGLEDSDLRVDRCRFDRCANCIDVSRDAFASGRGLVSVNGTVMNPLQSGITLTNISANIENTTISGGYVAVIAYLPGDLTRENCTVENTLSMANDLIWNGEGYQHSPAIQIHSSIPVTGLERLMKNNRINSSICLERYMMVDYPGYHLDQTYAGLLLNMSGGSSLFDQQMNPIGERAFSEGWGSADYFYSDPWGAQQQAFERYTHRVPVERIEFVGIGYIFNRLDEGALLFRAASDNGIGYATFDARPLRHPPDALTVNITLQDLCDLNVTDINQMIHTTETNETVLTISYYVSGTGKTVGDFQVTCTIGGVRLIRIEKTEMYSHTLDIDIRRIREGGELVLRVEPIGAQDVDLSNNEARTNITVINASRQFTGPVDLSGLWILGENANLTFRNCTISTTGAWASINGRGGNRIDIDNSTLDVSSIFVNIDNGNMRNTDIQGSGYPFEGSYQPGYGQLILGANNWTFDNVSCGYRARELHKLPASGREAFVADLLSDPKYYERINYILMFNAGADNLTVLNSTFLLMEMVELSGGNCMTLANTDVFRVYSTDISGENVTVSGSDFRDCIVYSAYGGNMTVEDNTFFNVSQSVSLGCSQKHCTFRDNRLEYGGALELAGPELPRLENNTFFGMHLALLFQCPGDPLAIIPLNHFEQIGDYLAERQKTISLALAHELVNSTSAPHITDLRVQWEDLLSIHTVNLYLSTPNDDENLSTYRSNSFGAFVWAMDRNGTVNALSSIPIKIIVSYEDRTDGIIERAIAIRDDYSWTEHIE